MDKSAFLITIFGIFVYNKQLARKIFFEQGEEELS